MTGAEWLDLLAKYVQASPVQPRWLRPLVRWVRRLLWGAFIAVVAVELVMIVLLLALRGEQM